MNPDHGTFGSVEEIQISKFKAICLAVLNRMRRTREPVDQTLSAAAPTGEWIGAMQDDGEIRDDLVAPAVDLSDWDALR